MENPNTSNTRKPVEKKHVLWLAMLVLAVSLACFFLGLMVGEQGNLPESPAVVSPPDKVVERIPARPEEKEPQDGKSVAEAKPAGAAEESAKKAGESDLTFYDILPSNTQAHPIGTGINVPQEKTPKEKTVAASTPAPSKPAAPVKPAAVTPAPSKPVAPVKPAAVTPAPPKPATPAKPDTTVSKRAIVQVASFKDKTGAERLAQRLQGKGLAATIQEANIPQKGVWYRVIIGAADRGAAEQIVQRLKKENLNGQIR
ncbi:MAG: SPOR domain-containing protein [Deltaproteobacteria bacterium]|nr:SPOR domain-containing protein [Deltaproteobacteria bacterium]